MSKLIQTAIATGILALSGCTTTGGLPQLPDLLTSSLGSIDARQANLPPATISLNEADEAEYNSAKDHYAKTITQGALLGGVIGAGACRILASTNTWQTAACGAVGVFLGGALGNNIAKQSERLIQDRESVDAALAEAEANRQATDRLITATDRNIDALRSQINRLKSQLDAGTITAEQYEAEQLEAQKYLIAINEDMEAVEDSLDGQAKLFAAMEDSAASSTDAAVVSGVPAIKAELQQTVSLQGEAVEVREKLIALEGVLGA